MKNPKLYLFLMLFIATSPAKSENTNQGGYPIYNHKDGTLTIPRIDAPDQVGRYQDVVFQFDTQPDLWILKEHQFRDNNASDLRISVSPQVLSGYFSTPDQVRLQISGEFTCSRIGQINQRRTGNLFEIQITQDPLKPGEVCNQTTELFQRTIQLDVDRLKAGKYRYDINNGVSIGSFTLPVDTIVPDECGGSPENDDSNCDAIFSGEVIESRNDDRGGYPVYNAEDGILTLPRVDVPDQVGRYQNVVLRFEAQRNGWALDEVQLRDHITMNRPRLLNVFLEVTAIYAGGINPHVTVHVVGEYTCGRIGQINQRRTDNLFEIQITEDPLQSGEICDQITRPFKRVIQLDVFRLSAGEYQYLINGPFTTTSFEFSTGDRFILPIDTIPLQDCGGNPEVVVDCSAIIF
ncbi:MAG: hypothetical protein H6936_12630 [Burkholderiales bacterium]|nr:hypothetical protein [Nitrosomonas sp.]MCP5275667.1 hypothetical protein [Burkholderiales bacterium]